ncbi:MAG TPA: amidohydrolase family protein [Acidimicrobiia bacterium]|nr:amidohydrolase family protein [Acidimicrobiia bacterium]
MSNSGYRVTGRVIPCEDETVIESGVVITEADKIAWVGPVEQLPVQYRGPEYTEIDGRGQSVMPGLIDGHMHISFGEAASEEELSIYTPAEYRAIRAAVDAEKALLAGVTSSCDPGGPYRVAVAVRDAIAGGLIQGPRMACAGKQITTQQGIADGFPSWIGVPESSFGALVRSNEELVQEIRNEVKDGVDLIKIAGSGSTSDEYAAFRLEELELAVDEAHRLGRPVTIHARSRQSVEYAAKAGVDWIMHASYMDEPTLEMVLEKQIPILPALTLLINTLEANRADLTPAARDRFGREIDAAVGIISKAAKAGATLICGSESGFAMTPYGEWHAREMEIFVDMFGTTHFEALLAMTRNAARAVPRHTPMIGTLTPGKYADLLVVAGNPDENVRILQDKTNLVHVMQGGRIVKAWRPSEAVRMKHAFEKTHLYTPVPYRSADREAGPSADELLGRGALAAFPPG